MRIPTTAGSNKYIYASKTLANPGKINVYAVTYIPDAGSTDSIFSGKEIWIDFQDWKSYGIQYDKNVATSYLDPITLAQPDWEIVTTMHGHYRDSSGVIVLQPGGGKDTLSSELGMKPTGPDDMGCYGETTWVGRLFKNIGEFFEGVGDWIGGIFGGDDTGPGTGTGPGFNWGSGGGYYGPGGGTPGGGWTGGGSASVHGGPNVGELEYGVRVNGSAVDRQSQNFNPNRTVQFVVSVLGLHRTESLWLEQHVDLAEKMEHYWLEFMPDLTSEQKKALLLKHLEMMMTNPTYLNFVTTYDQEYPIGIPLLNLADYTFTPGSPSHPITNRNDYLKCFKNVAGATYKVTLAIDQPVPHSRKAFKWFSNGTMCDVGHAFLILEQNINGVKTVRSIGWYPAGATTPLNPVDPGVLNNDAEHDYDVALVNNISGSNFMDIINEIKNNSHTNYDLNNYNCSNWAYGMIFMHPMDNISVSHVCWPLGFGMNPGTLGEDVRAENLESYQSRLTNGTAPVNEGTCP